MSTKPTKPMTIEGYLRLAEEYRQLWEVERPKVVQGVADAAAEGDRSENAEYIYGKKRLREIDKRLRYLGGLIKDVELIDRRLLRGEIVCFGATVVVEDDQGKVFSWTLVGEGEADAAKGRISWKAPVGKSLLGKRVGDVVEVNLPKGTREFSILELKFGGS